MFLYPAQPKLVRNPQTIMGMIDESWWFQIKKNGSRAIVEGVDDKVKLWGRDGTVLNISYERDWTPMLNLFRQPFKLDGELIGRKQGEVSNRLYLWDMIQEAGVDFRGSTYRDRYNQLMSGYSRGVLFDMSELIVETYDPTQKIITNGFSNEDGTGIKVGIAKNYQPSMWKDLLTILSDLRTGEDEGFVFKNPEKMIAWGYQEGKETVEMVKFVFKYYEGWMKK